MTGNTIDAASAARDTPRREQLLRILAGTTFLIFFQAYMVAPLLPRLAVIFNAPVETVAYMVPAFLIAYGVATLFYGILSDRIGRRTIMIASLSAFILLTALTGFAQSAQQLTIARLVTGLGASGVVPLGLALIGDLFPYKERGRPLGWLFGAMAGGMAVGSTVGVMLEPFISWRGLFFAVAALAFIMLLKLLPYRDLLTGPGSGASLTLGTVFKGYRALLGSARGRRTYGYVLLNAVFHSGVFTWLGVYFSRKYALGELGIGLALLGYGIPGFLLGPVIGRLADRYGRSRLIPLGLMLAGSCAAALSLDLPLLAPVLLVTLLSLGYDLTQPLLAGIVTDLGPNRGQAMGLNVFTLFVGFGGGSLLFGSLLGKGIDVALNVFGAVAILAGILAAFLLRSEMHK